ncbi:MAG: DUF3108 domain-containing protein [Planctomycetes bacterium]|nr:DUF3108 domain-containing protein [Planctomycetota bacterium]
MGYGKRLFLSGAVFAALALALLLALAFPSVRVGPTAPLAPPERGRRPFQPGQTVRYEFLFQGLAVGTAWLKRAAEEQKPNRLELLYGASVSPSIDWAWNFRVRGRTVLESDTLLPKVAEVTTEKKQRHKRRSTLFDRHRGVARIETWKSQDDRPHRKEVPLAGDFDIPSAILALSRMENAGMIHVLRADDRYEVTLAPGGIREITVPAGRFDAREWELRVRKLGEEPEDGKPPAQLRVWVDAALGLPVKAEAQLSIGRVQLQLVSAGGEM